MEIVIGIIVVVLIIVMYGKAKGAPLPSSMSESAILLRLQTESDWINKYLIQPASVQQRSSLKTMFEEKTRYVEQLRSELAKRNSSTNVQRTIEHELNSLLESATKHQASGQSTTESLRSALSEKYSANTHNDSNSHTLDAPSPPTMHERAESGDPEAKFVVGDTLLREPSSRNEGLIWVQKSAAQGFANAQFVLGIYIFDHASSQSDYERSISLLSESAENGHGIAPYYLAKFYELGMGIEADPIVSKMWLSRTPPYARARASREFETFKWMRTKIGPN